MEKLFLKKLTFLFCCTLFCFSQTSFARGIEAHEEPDRRINQLNESLKTIGYFGVEKVATLPKSQRPLRGFIAKWGFHREGERILRFIDLLEKNKQFKECTRCLNALNELLYLQFRKCLVDREVDPTAVMQLGIENVGQVDSEKRYSIGTTPGDYAKSRMLEILFDLYSCQSEEKDAFVYSYDGPVLATIMTRVIIDILRVRSQSNWSYEKKRDFLAQKLDRYKREFIIAFGKLNKEGVCIVGMPTLQQVTGLIDILKNIMVERVKPFPWKKVVKWTLIGGAVVLVVGGIVWGAQKVFSSVGQNAGESFKEGLERAGTDPINKLIEKGVPVRLEMDEETAARLAPLLREGGAMAADLRAMAEAVERATANGVNVNVNVHDDIVSFVKKVKEKFLDDAEKSGKNKKDAKEEAATLTEAFTKFLNGAADAWFESKPGEKSFAKAFTGFLDETTTTMRNTVNRGATNRPGGSDKQAPEGKEDASEDEDELLVVEGPDDAPGDDDNENGNQPRNSKRTIGQSVPGFLDALTHLMNNTVNKKGDDGQKTNWPGLVDGLARFFDQGSRFCERYNYVRDEELGKKKE